MAISKVQIKDFLVFKGKFTVDFCSGINLLIGRNGIGKTTLLKSMYALLNYDIFEKTEIADKTGGTPPGGFFYGMAIEKYFPSFANTVDENITWKCPNNKDPRLELLQFSNKEENGTKLSVDVDKRNSKGAKCVYIPEKDLLSNSKSLPETVQYGKLNFAQTDIDIIVKARVAPSRPKQPLVKRIEEIIGGCVENDGESFFVIKQDVIRSIPFSLEASGFRKFGLLATLIHNEQITNDSVLFWDEPENSLSPELIPVLVDILLELSRNGVQIFLATHSEILASYFFINQQQNDSVMFYSLYKDEDGQIKADANKRFDLLEQNKLTEEPVKLYEKQIEKGLGNG